MGAVDVLAAAWVEANSKAETTLRLNLFPDAGLFLLINCILFLIFITICFTAWWFGRCMLAMDGCCSSLIRGVAVLALLSAGILMLGSTSITPADPEPVWRFWNGVNHEQTIHFPPG